MSQGMQVCGISTFMVTIFLVNSQPPEGSDSALAQSILTAEFHKEYEGFIVVVLWCLDSDPDAFRTPGRNCSVVNNKTRAISEHIEELALAQPPVLSLDGYYHYLNTMPLVGSQFLSASERATIINIRVNQSDVDALFPLDTALQVKID